LERARYFAEHAKSAQRDYLNFLNNAEHEELQEQNAAQAVEMEKANVRIESAPVEQVTAEVTAAKESWKLAQGVAANAQRRFRDYSNLETHLRDLEADQFRFSVKRSLAGAFLSSFTFVTQDRQEPLPASCKRNRDKERSRSACRGRPDSQIFLRFAVPALMQPVFKIEQPPQRIRPELPTPTDDLLPRRSRVRANPRRHLCVIRARGDELSECSRLQPGRSEKPAIHRAVVAVRATLSKQFRPTLVHQSSRHSRELFPQCHVWTARRAAIKVRRQCAELFSVHSPLIENQEAIVLRRKTSVFPRFAEGFSHLTLDVGIRLEADLSPEDRLWPIMARFSLRSSSLPLPTK
jgi:hypothetical protein